MMIGGARAGVLVRYLARRVLVAIVWVSVVLLGVFTLVEMIRELRDLAGDYGLIEMAGYMLQTTPRRLYDIFPFAALIGTLIGVGSLSQSNELVAMRAAGLHRKKISAYVLAVVGLCLLGLVAVSEWWVPSLETKAQADRDQARLGQIDLDRSGALWLRDDQLMVRIGHSIWGGDDQLALTNVLIYRLNDDLQPVTTYQASQAVHEVDQWRLDGVTITELNGQGVSVAEHDRWRLPSTIAPELFDAALTRPRLLSTQDLMAMRAFLAANALDDGPYAQAMWERVLFPVNVLAMVLIGLPFALGGVFRQSPRGGLGLNVFVGIGLGLVFFVLSRVVQGVVTLWPIPIWLGSLLPAVLISVVALGLLARR